MSGAYRILIKGGRVIDPASGFDAIAPLCIADGLIAALGSVPDGFAPDCTVDAAGQIVSPGFIDLCARMREPGQTHKASIASETAAAAKGGVTTLCCPPDTSPIIDTPAVATLIQEKAEQAGKARLLPIGALTRQLEGKELSAMAALKQAGCVAVGNAHQALANPLVLRRALEYAATHDLLVVLRPEDPWLAGAGCAHEGAIATRLGLPGIPEAAETVALAQALTLIEISGARVHFGQLSCARAVIMLGNAQKRGLRVTGDVAAHHLRLTEDALEGFDAQCHVRPPLRSAEDRDALRAAVASGVLGAVCSDHQPHEPDAKLDAFPSTEPGMAALETLLPLLAWEVRENRLDWPTALARLTTGPADILDLPLGRLSEGSPADVCVFHPDAEWRLDEEHWLSRGRNTPFRDQTLPGHVTLTLLTGQVTYAV
jgi:dihydroorotase